MITEGPSAGGNNTLDFSQLSTFCDEMLASLTRSDQRRWGEVYVRGLACIPGRKSIRRISDLVVGHDANQSLQQFVNQSPWAWEPVRRTLAERMSQTLLPQAWVVREVVFPKNGGNSVAVSRQYAPSVGRVVNCQRSIGVFLAGGAGVCPVNWRLLLPPDWDGDTARRLKCRIPPEERSEPGWRHVVDAVDEMANRWRLPRLPVIVDMRHERDIEPLLVELESRGLSYLVQVATTTILVPARQLATGDDAGTLTVGGLLAATAKRASSPISWYDERIGRPTSSLFGLATVPGPGRAGGVTPCVAPRRSRQVLADWPSGQDRRPSAWLTNNGANGILELARLVRVWDRSSGDIEAFVADSGLRAFEGRSFPGWHHHVTLVSLAQGFRLLHKLARERAADRWLRPYVEA